ncbi:hypothetical protein FRC01_004752 [Tulasnella sp. 417]|nr:hypothetical protein FRC01_004752 [Tulasnella sp. 417]
MEARALTTPFSGVESTDTLPVRCLAAVGEALKAAKARMNQQVDELIAHLSHRWNLASSIHRLPSEVLAMVFREFEPYSPGHTHLLDLLLVCRVWYDTIMGSPELWGSFAAYTPYNIARLVIDRSQTLPISVDWDTSVEARYRWPRRRDPTKVLGLAIENSMRIKSINVYSLTRNDSDLRRLLEAPTPILETLRVVSEDFVVGETTDGDPDFVLSDGSQLKHLSFRDITTLLDSPRLSNLMTLSLETSAVPDSLQLLLGILSGSQRLEVLHIRDKERSLEEYQAEDQVVLPHLRELVLSQVANIYVAAFLASVYTPSCSHVEVKDKREILESDSEAVRALDSMIWRPGNDQGVVLLGGTDSHMISRSLDISIASSRIVVDSLDERCRLEFNRLDITEIVARLSTTLSQMPSLPVLHLQHVGTGLEEPSFADLLPWNGMLDSLLVKGRGRCLSVIRQLSEQQVLPGTDGRADWICRGLSSIQFEYLPDDEEDIALDGEGLLSLVRQRWSSEGGLAGAARPESFVIQCRKANFPNIWSLVDEIAKILPSFRLVDG